MIKPLGLNIGAVSAKRKVFTITDIEKALKPEADDVKGPKDRGSQSLAYKPSSSRRNFPNAKYPTAMDYFLSPAFIAKGMPNISYEGSVPSSTNVFRGVVNNQTVTLPESARKLYFVIERSEEFVQYHRKFSPKDKQDVFGDEDIYSRHLSAIEGALSKMKRLIRDGSRDKKLEFILNRNSVRYSVDSIYDDFNKQGDPRFANTIFGLTHRILGLSQTLDYVEDLVNSGCIISDILIVSDGGSRKLNPKLTESLTMAIDLISVTKFKDRLASLIAIDLRRDTKGPYSAVLSGIRIPEELTSDPRNVIKLAALIIEEQAADPKYGYLHDVERGRREAVQEKAKFLDELQSLVAGNSNLKILVDEELNALPKT